MKKLNVLIIEDHSLVAEGWKMMLQSQVGFDQVQTCRSAEEGLALLESYKPDIILLDVNLPHITGIEAIPDILGVAPNSRIIGLSVYALPAYAKQMIANGAFGYLTKSSTPEEFLEAIGEVMEGRKYICIEIRDVLTATLIKGEISSPQDISKLTNREKEVISHIKQGLTSKEQAAIMGLSVRTIEVYRYNILKKLKLSNSAALLDFIQNKDPLI